MFFDDEVITNDDPMTDEADEDEDAEEATEEGAEGEEDGDDNFGDEEEE